MDIFEVLFDDHGIWVHYAYCRTYELANKYADEAQAAGYGEINIVSKWVRCK